MQEQTTQEQGTIKKVARFNRSIGSFLGVITAVTLLLFSPHRAVAAPNGYNQIPIAKVFGNGVFAFSLAVSRIGSSSAFCTTQYGLFNRFEVGLDYQIEPRYQQTFLLNAKYLLVHSPGHLPEIACGLQNIATGQKVQPYLVATTQPGNLGFSFGTIRLSEGGFVGMGGAAYNLTPKVQLVADYIGGRNNYATVGVIAAVTDAISVNLAYARPNSTGGSSSGPSGFVLNISYVFHALHGKGGDKGSGGGNKNPTSPAG